jgi:hypothetical protein
VAPLGDQVVHENNAWLICVGLLRFDLVPGVGEMFVTLGLPMLELFWTNGSIVVKALCYKLEGHGLRPDQVNDFY